MNGRKGMGDYTSPLYNQTNRPQGHAPAGRIVQPTIPVDPSKEFTDEQRMLGLIRRLWQEKHVQYIDERPREAQRFIYGGQEQTAATSALTSITSFTVPTNYAGTIEGVHLKVFSPSFYEDITWELYRNGALYPFFGSQGGLIVSEEMNNLDFNLELTSGMEIDIQARNGNANQTITVAAQIVGWYEQLTEWKKDEFGRTPKGL